MRGISAFVNVLDPKELVCDCSVVDSVGQDLWPYMSPEQTGRMNRSVDSRTDLYSLGCVLYELMMGKYYGDGGIRWLG